MVLTEKCKYIEGPRSLCMMNGPEAHLRKNEAAVKILNVENPHHFAQALKLTKKFVM